jgi:tetratricopeptide (TPR) repeat protein/serine/threonine protein kinase
MNERSIFMAAVAMESAAQRSAYLDEACGGNAVLRQRVEALLGSHEQAGSFLVKAVPERLAEQLAEPEQPSETCGEPSAPDPGPIEEGPDSRVGPYQLLQEIGEGGMGTVYLAEQSQPVRRMVALKIIKPGMDSRQVVARFEAERQALALMDHPNIARVLDAGTTENGRPYFVMELVKGVPITKFCDEWQATPRQRLELFVPVCQAVQHAHQKGIIHRDLKPSNVLVCLYDGKPVPKVIDFGIAKATGQSLTERTMFTELGQVVGTLEYMSPEQAELNQLDIDTRSDIYSLGVLLYELLTGSTPLERKRLNTVGVLEVLRLIREEEPPRPSTRLSESKETLPSISAQRQMEPARLTKLVRGELDWIVMKALEKDRNRRYESASAFAADVERYLRDEPVVACPPSARYRLRKFARRNKAKLAIAAALLLTVTVMAGSIGWAVRDRLEREAQSQRAQTARRAQVSGQVREAWNAARTLLAANKIATAHQKLVEALTQLGNERAALADLAAQVETGAAELDRYQRFLDLIDRAHEAETAPVLEAAAASDSPSGPGTPPSVWTVERRPARAVPFLLRALDCYGVLEREDWSTTLAGGLLGQQQIEHVRRTAYAELLWLANDLGTRQQEHRSGNKLSRRAAARQALRYLKRAESTHRPTQAFHVLRADIYEDLGEKEVSAAARQLAARTPPTLALDYFLRALVAFDAGQLDVAVQACEAALVLEPTDYWSLMRLGHCLSDLGRNQADFAGAARVYAGCILKRPDHAHAYSCRGDAYVKLGQNDKAVADCTRAIALDPTDALAWSSRAAAYVGLGLPARAVADYARAIKLEPKNPRPWSNRGNAYLQLRRYASAVTDCSTAIDLDPKYARAWNNRGAAYHHLGQYDKAVADYSQAIKLEPKFALAYANRGNIYLVKQGEHEKAVADYSQVIQLEPKNRMAWCARGLAYRKLGQYEKAVIDYSRAIELNPKEVMKGIWGERGFAYLRLRQYARAIADCSRAIELEPKGAANHHNRGLAYANLRQYAQAIADFTTAIELEPKNMPAWGERGLAYANLRQYAQAIPDLSTAIELDPKERRNWNNRGGVYWRLGEYEKAVADYSQAIELDPTYADSWLNRGAAYHRLRHYDKASANYSRAIELEPGQAQAYERFAWLLATCPDKKRHDPKRAVELARKAVQLNPKDSNNWATLGMAHFRAGEWKESIVAVHAAMTKSKGANAYHWFILAISHWQLGDRVEARKRYDQAVQWMEKNAASLSRDHLLAEELRRFRSEAEEVLQLGHK